LEELSFPKASFLGLEAFGPDLFTFFPSSQTTTAPTAGFGYGQYLETSKPP